MNFIQHEFEYDSTIKNGQKELFAEGDVIVPDTHPDIISVYQLDGSAVITDITPSDGKISVFGKSVITIVYKPESDSEVLKSIKTKLDFSCQIENASITAATKHILECDIADIDFQLINSRKIRLKSRIQIDYTLKNTQTVMLPLACEETAQLNAVNNTVRVNNILQTIYPVFEINEKSELAPGQPAAAEIIKSNLEISESEYKCVGGKIIIKCMCVVTVLYKDISGDFSIAEIQLPFSEICEMNTVDEDVTARLSFSAGDISCEISDNSDGDPRVLNISSEIYAALIISKHSESEYISDCYLSGKKAEPVISEVSMTQAKSSDQRQVNIREMLTPPQGCPPVNRICKVSAKPCIKKADCSGGKCTVSGSVTVFVSYLTADTSRIMCCFTKSIPFEECFESECDTDSCDVSADIKHCAYSINTAGNIDVRILLELAVSAECSSKIHIIEQLNELENQPSPHGIKIYFAAPDESMWDIGKKFLVSTDILNEYNSDSSDTGGKRRIIVPML